MAKKQIPTPASSSAIPSSARAPIQEKTEEQKETKERTSPSKAPGIPKRARATKATGSSTVSKPAGINGKVKMGSSRTAISGSNRRAAENRENLQGSGIEREEIALRAYFISERRRAQGEFREPSEDWLQAERELITEIQRSSKAKR